MRTRQSYQVKPSPESPPPSPSITSYEGFLEGDISGWPCSEESKFGPRPSSSPISESRYIVFNPTGSNISITELERRHPPGHIDIPHGPQMRSQILPSLIDRVCHPICQKVLKPPENKPLAHRSWSSAQQICTSGFRHCEGTQKRRGGIGKRSDQNNDNSDDSDDGRRRKKSLGGLKHHEGIIKRLKCPYYQRNSIKHTRNACRGAGFTDMAKLKSSKAVNMASNTACYKHLLDDPICRIEPSPNLDDDRICCRSYSISPSIGLHFRNIRVWMKSRKPSSRCYSLMKGMFYLPEPGLSENFDQLLAKALEEELPAISRIRERLVDIIQQCKKKALEMPSQQIISHLSNSSGSLNCRRFNIHQKNSIFKWRPLPGSAAVIDIPSRTTKTRRRIFTDTSWMMVRDHYEMNELDAQRWDNPEHSWELSVEDFQRGKDFHDPSRKLYQMIPSASSFIEIRPSPNILSIILIHMDREVWALTPERNPEFICPYSLERKFHSTRPSAIGCQVPFSSMPLPVKNTNSYARKWTNSTTHSQIKPSLLTHSLRELLGIMHLIDILFIRVLTLQNLNPPPTKTFIMHMYILPQTDDSPHVLIYQFYPTSPFCASCSCLKCSQRLCIDTTLYQHHNQNFCSARKSTRVFVDFVSLKAKSRDKVTQLGIRYSQSLVNSTSVESSRKSHSLLHRSIWHANTSCITSTIRVSQHRRHQRSELRRNELILWGGARASLMYPSGPGPKIGSHSEPQGVKFGCLRNQSGINIEVVHTQSLPSYWLVTHATTTNGTPCLPSGQFRIRARLYLVASILDDSNYYLQFLRFRFWTSMAPTRDEFIAQGEGKIRLNRSAINRGTHWSARNEMEMACPNAPHVSTVQCSAFEAPPPGIAMQSP
ncbi:uncharacterized protein BDR25DRAFT_351581 [Lindgomyces ingoldianus]|uniref:Uncharacterized protein n=1 Tax=Lindgomyces ingoldianus TaxID=673940 RepID=A0ACB6R402_9PLEO|nr:uncharacterized protein BDR25DRAFT_351581 [Lindgomyces ingoldianus]KAF2474049.1 hypothetical protein BDR25DRAFT_351581 [Lindgomyces ingoldianus]